MPFRTLLLCAVGGLALFVFASVVETAVRLTTGLVLFDAWVGGGLGIPLRFFALSLPGGRDQFSAARLLLDWAVWSGVLCALVAARRALARS
jgi:hypothetical protein